MPQAHRSRPALRRTTLILVPVAGLAAAVLAAGPATAEAQSRGTISPSGADSTGPRSDSGTRPGGGTNQRGTVTHGNDSTGIHAGDPFGYYHFDMNPVLQNQHPRESTPVPRQAPPLDGRAGNPATWSPSWNSDGSRYTVCRPLASFC